MSRLSDRDRAELDYLNVRNDIEELVDRVGYENILKHMIEKLDHIDDINNIKSISISDYLLVRKSTRFKATECLKNINK